MLVKLAIWLLRRKKVSVMISFNIEQTTLKCLNYNSYFYDNELNDVKYLTRENDDFDIPTGKFSQQLKSTTKSTPTKEQANPPVKKNFEKCYDCKGYFEEDEKVIVHQGKCYCTYCYERIEKQY